MGELGEMTMYRYLSSGSSTYNSWTLTFTFEEEDEAGNTTHIKYEVKDTTFQKVVDHMFNKVMKVIGE